MADPTTPERVLTQQSLVIVEAIPADLGFLDEYQQNAASQITRDENGHTIRGKHPLAHMYDGLVEELGEITGPDKVEPDYNRLRALLLIDKDAEDFRAAKATPTAIERQLKEFGDVSWYLANFLDWLDIKLSFVVEPGMVAWHLEDISNPRGSEEFSHLVDSLFPWQKFLSATGSLRTAAEAVTQVLPSGRRFPKHRDERGLAEKALVVASGKFVVSSIHMLRARYDVSYEEVLDMNRRKIEQRIANNTVFDKAGGDDR